MLTVSFEAPRTTRDIPPEDDREAQIGRSIIQLAQELVDLHTVKDDFEDVTKL